MKKKHSLSLATCVVALSIISFSQGAEANQVKEKKEAVVHKGGMGFEARIGVGYLTGEANEWVYNPQQNRPESKLTWTLDPVLMVGGGITFRPVSWLTLNADVWTIVSDSSVMDDWDWIYESSEPSPEWTDWSHHEETSVEDGLIIDLNASIPVYKTPNYTVQGIIGYLHDHWSWDATKGGTYIYSTDASNGKFRDDIGVFPLNGKGITYEQTFDTPYLGIGLGARFNPITINAKVIGSIFVSAEDYDHHSDKGVKYYGDYSGENMIGLTGEVVYDLTESLSLGAVVNYVHYSTMTGDTVVNDYGDEGTSTNDPDGCGTELQRTSVNISLAYRF